ncbi:MAG: hypothetical protein ACO1TE_03085 [Prosthecobacter sp.]
MSESSEKAAKRPASVLWAGIVFWTMSLGILSLHLHFVTLGIVVFEAFLMATLLLAAAVAWTVSPRGLFTYYLGTASLIACVIWCALTARTQFRLAAQFPGIMNDVVVSVLLVVIFSWHAYRFAFGRPSRAYFRL